MNFIFLIFGIVFMASCAKFDSTVSLSSNIESSIILPTKLSAGETTNLSIELQFPALPNENFELKSFQNSDCSLPTNGTLNADENPVFPQNQTLEFNNVSYVGPTNINQNIYLKVESNKGRSTQCSEAIQILFESFVLGQPDFISNIIQSIVGPSTLTNSYLKLHSDGSRFFVSDYDNHRVLIWNTIPTSLNQPPDVVLGQSSFLTNTENFGGLSASSISYPGGIYSSGGKLFLADYGNNRVLIWNSIPTTNNQPADVVLGQALMTTATPNNGGRSASSLSAPWHLFVSNNKLFVVDYTNARILIWNSLPTTNKQPADVVVGQANMTSAVCGSSQNIICEPYEVFVTDQKLILTDSSNNRVLIWNSIPITNGENADVVVGQSDFTSIDANQNGTVSSQTLFYPTSVFVQNNQLYIQDTMNYRLLKYNAIPTSNNTAADAVFGQDNFISSTSGLAKNRINYTEGLHIDNDRVILGDSGNSRILFLNKIDAFPE
jgi:hypothetical protein